jgi:hypothetical protein
MRVIKVSLLVLLMMLISPLVLMFLVFQLGKHAYLAAEALYDGFLMWL